MNFSFEKKLFANNYKLIGAIDEAGRGPLAGPVVSACVLVSRDFKPSGKLLQINDSKKITAKKREDLYSLIIKNFSFVSVGSCSHLVIDRINILQATLLSMKKAVSKLPQKPDIILIDGKQKIQNLGIEQMTIIHGDVKVFSIAAASIVAKVIRDRLMKKFSLKYPVYKFDIHKGYGTKEHYKLLKKFGPCPIHRRSFYLG